MDQRAVIGYSIVTRGSPDCVRLEGRLDGQISSADKIMRSDLRDSIVKHAIPTVPQCSIMVQATTVS
jgi:hypothetical protein